MKKISVISLVLIFVLLFNTLVLAEGLTDVEVDGWAEQYINKVVSSDVMPAYDDQTFRPSENVTKMEVINVIYRMALLKNETTEAEVDGYLEDHQSVIDGLLLPNIQAPYGASNHRAIAYALEKNILRASELSLFYINGEFEVISKVDASVYMAKALNIYLEENVNKFYEIRYKDGNEITLMAWPYINLLIEKAVVSEDGNEGYFYPNTVVNRDILSVITTGVLREIEGYVKGDKTTETQSSVTSSGKVSIIHYDKNIVEIRDQYGRLNVYDASVAAITLNGDVITLQNLEAGADVEIKVSGSQLISVKVVEEYKQLSGTFRNVLSEMTVKGETYRAVMVKANDKIEYYKALNSVLVERDYQPSTLDDLDENDQVVVFFENGYLKKIESFSNKVILEGALERASNFNQGDAVSLKLFNDKRIEQVLENSIVKTNVTEDLVKGDIVKITLSQGKIIAVEATGLSTEAHGRVTEIVIAQSPRITLVNSKGISKSYNIAKNVLVKNLGTVDSNGIYALRLDQDVSMAITGLSVSEIEINKAVEKTEFEAEITEIHANINLIKALDKNNKTWIVSLEGSNQKIADYAVGDQVYIYGVELSADLFEADLIIVLD